MIWTCIKLGIGIACGLVAFYIVLSVLYLLFMLGMGVAMALLAALLH